MPETATRFTPPAAANLPPGALDSATDGASMLDVWATTPEGRNLLAHTLTQLARDGWLRTSPDAQQAWDPADTETPTHRPA
jgi:hypothetical protein